MITKRNRYNIFDFIGKVHNNCKAKTHFTKQYLVSGLILFTPFSFLTYCRIVPAMQDFFSGLALMDIVLFAIVFILAFLLYLATKKAYRAKLMAANTEVKFNKIYTSGMLGLLFVNLDGRVLQANDTLLNIIGYTRDDLNMGLINWKTLTPADYGEITAESLLQLKATGSCVPFEKEYIRKDGQRVNVMLGSALLESTDSTEAITYVIDISERKLSKAREQQYNKIIKKQKEELTRILMNAPALISIRRGPELTLEFMNKAAIAFARTDEHIGLTTQQIYDKFKVSSGSDILEDVYRTGKARSGKAHHLRFDRTGNGEMEDAWFDFITEPLHDADGNVDGVASFGFNVTDIIKATQEVKANETRFRFLADAIPHKMWTAGPDGIAIYYNQRWYDYTGTTSFDELKAYIWDSIHPDDLVNNGLLWEKSIQTGQNLEVEQRLRQKDGVYLWHLSRCIPYKDEHGNITMWVGTSTNIHEQKIAQEALKNSEEHFKALANHNALLIWQVNAQGNTVYVNDTYINFTGIQFDPDHAKNALSAIHPEDLEQALEHFKISFIAREPMHNKYKFRKYDGEYRWVVNNANPIYNPEFSGYVGSMTDIHEQEIAQRATKVLLNKKDEFLGIASHELKTPITSMKAALQLLNRISDTDFNPQKIRSFVNMANKQINKLTGIVDDLLDVTKIQSGKMQLNITKYSIQESLYDCIEGMQPYSHQHSLIILNNDPLFIVADKIRIEQVIINFLSNAIKYSPNSNIIHINVQKEGNQMKFSVTDYGIGIPVDKQPLIFDRFFRVHDSSQSFSGLGLGLYISAEIIYRHDGKIGINSEEGKGSTFWFTLALPDTA